MGTTTSLKVGLDLLTQSAVFASNNVIAMGFRVEHHRVSGGRYMIDNADEIEPAIKTWLREMKLERVTYELYSRETNTAYEDCIIELDYLADPQLEVTRPPLAQLEELLAKLEKLPSDAQFRMVVDLSPGATEIPGWVHTQLRDLAGGLKAEHQIGEGPYGYGKIGGRIIYTEANWKAQGGTPPPA
jgi:hypothetical protein